MYQQAFINSNTTLESIDINSNTTLESIDIHQWQ